ncbi:MAG: glycosyltransferase family 2 protein [Planctomycetes bacterium]|jgi:glycosyltransferase involved in cell wall biosynthesis|nr:glycosyltransferase family 2 protein [Planctomycetota bacterium]
MDYLKIGRATELSGKDKVVYRILEIIPGFFSLGSLLALLILSYFKPTLVAYFIIAFNVYWLLLVIFLAIYLISSYSKMKRNLTINWEEKCRELNQQSVVNYEHQGTVQPLYKSGWTWNDVTHLIILPVYQESIEIIETCLDSLLNDGFPAKKMIVVLTIEERAGIEAKERGEIIVKKYNQKFRNFIFTIHPDGLVGEMKVKGANQAWGAQEVKREVIDKEKLDYNKILVSVFDIDTVVKPGYFFSLTYKFLTVYDPYRASYQPIPMYHNNIWEAPFFSRVAATSNTFWQMMMQIRQEKLVTYSSHSMTFKALAEIGFWSTHMVSEDSRIFWHCLMYYNGDYRVEPLYHTVSMDVTMDRNFWRTARNLYKQQRRWAWGAENIPFLIFNSFKRWQAIKNNHKLGRIIKHAFIQIYGFHSWGTNALIIAVVGWMPLILGGERFNTTVLSGNLPGISSLLMNLAMIGLILSAIVSNLLLPPMPAHYNFKNKLLLILEWMFVPFSVVIFGAIPCLDAQARLMFGKYMGFWITPKERKV